MEKITLTINADEGLHARPADLFVRTAGSFASDIQVRNLTTDSEFNNAKSILSVLTLGVVQGHEIEITAEGDDELDAIEKIRWLVENNFPGEGQSS